jgi:hypothetical protein
MYPMDLRVGMYIRRKKPNPAASLFRQPPLDIRYISTSIQFCLPGCW